MFHDMCPALRGWLVPRVRAGEARKPLVSGASVRRLARCPSRGARVLRVDGGVHEVVGAYRGNVDARNGQLANCAAGKG